jgi:DMSO/TMAO reductase YedYZ molybdopterin-dependent catalytic subunit
MDYIDLNLSGKTESPPSKSEIALQASFLAAAALIALMAVGRFIFHLPLLPELIADWAFAVMPASFAEDIITMFGAFAKRLGFIGCSIAYLTALTIVGTAYLGWIDKKRLSATLSGMVFGASIWLTTVSALIPLLGGGMFGRNLWRGALISSISLLIYHLIYGVVVVRLRSAFGARADLAQTGGRLLNRRTALRTVMIAIVGAAAYDIFKPILETWRNATAGKVASGSGVFPDINGLSREITPTSDFYKVSKNPFDPEVDIRRWRLEIGGMVDEPLSFTYEEIRQLPSVEQTATLMCISYVPGDNLLGHAKWKGVRMRDILEKAKVKSGVIDILLRATDDYTDSIPLDRAMAESTLLVYEMNGEPLVAEHGFPVRLLVPAIYGMKNVKWITRIEAINYDFKGYWQKRGWNDTAIYKTISRIDVPNGNVKFGNVTIAGVAFAGDRGISKVEISTNNGQTWLPAELKSAQSINSWVLWQYPWLPTAPGNYGIAVRATDGKGLIQGGKVTPPFPDGSSGYHRIKLTVT